MGKLGGKMAKKIRIDKLLGNLGYGSRKDIKNYVKQGAVTVDGASIKDAGLQVDPVEQKVAILGQEIFYREFVYIMMNKPDGVVSATYDKRERTVISLLAEEYLPFEVFPVGRLDKDTEGFLLLTNDGQLAHDLLSPKKHVPKKYYAKVQGKVTEEDIVAFSKGVVLDDGYETLPAELRIISSDAISEIELVLHEGKFHQVKRMFEAVGKKVLYLKRISMGNLQLDENLELGEYRELTQEELSLLRERA